MIKDLFKVKPQTFDEPPFARFLFANTKMAWFWLIVRVYVGWLWLSAGWDKVFSPAWTGENAGVSISGFVGRALTKVEGPHPDVQGWYAWFLENVVGAYPVFWSYVIAYGEVLVGVGLILGALTGIAAFFGLIMNLSFLLAGTVSVNPLMFTLSIGLILAWRVAGYVGLDRFLLPLLGTPWQRGRISKNIEKNIEEA